MCSACEINVPGFSNHQSWSGCGNAVPARVDEFRITALKELGASMWRGSYPGACVMNMILLLDARYLFVG
jgi:hypothetical protein